MAVQVESKLGINAWASNLDDESSTEAFLAWSGSRGSTGRSTTLAHSDHEKNVESQSSVADAVSSSPATPDVNVTRPDGVRIHTADTTAVEIVSSSLPSTYDDPVSPKTLKATRNNPSVPGVMIKPELDDEQKHDLQSLPHEVDYSNRLDTDVVGHTPVKLQTQTQRQIAARVARRIMGLPSDTLATMVDNEMEDNFLSECKFVAGVPEQRQPCISMESQVVNGGGTEIPARDSDTLSKGDHESESASEVADRVEDMHLDQIAQEAGFEEGIHGPPLNPRAQSWHLPTNSHHTLHDVNVEHHALANRSCPNGDSPQHGIAHRSIVFHDLPKDADYYLVQSLVHGGSIQAMSLSDCSAVVTFTTEQACRLYVSKYPAGITFRHKNKLVTAGVSQSTKVDKTDLILAGQLSAGASRVVRVIHVDRRFTVNNLHELAVGVDGSRAIESVIDICRSGVRSTIFRFTNVADSVKFKSLLTEDEEVWGDSNIRWAEDPCERAAGLHFD